MSAESFDWDDCLDHVASTDIGMRRTTNQDSCGVAIATTYQDWFDQGHLFVVADGMGAHAAGELASQLAVENVTHIYRKARRSPPEALEQAIREANQEIHRRGQANAEFHNMGTTCSTLLLLPQGALVGHVGDSRVYRLRGRQMYQLTFDHSLVWEMEEAGQVEANGNAIPKNVITRSLGPQPLVKVDVEGPFPLEIGDTFLICSDGLTARVEDVEIATAMAWLAPDPAAELLVNLANLRGGPDNITIVIAKVTGSEMESRNARAAPLMVGTDRDKRPPLHIAWWLGLGVSGLLSLVLAMTRGLNWGILPFVVFASLLIIILMMKAGGSKAVRLAGGRRLGKGPHRSYEAADENDFAEKLLNDMELGRETAQKRNWDFDWADFDHEFDDGRGLLKQGKPKEALESLTRASSILRRLFQTEQRKTIG